MFLSMENVSTYPKGLCVSSRYRNATIYFAGSLKVLDLIVIYFHDINGYFLLLGNFGLKEMDFEKKFESFNIFIKLFSDTQFIFSMN